MPRRPRSQRASRAAPSRFASAFHCGSSGPLGIVCNSYGSPAGPAHDAARTLAKEQGLDADRRPHSQARDGRRRRAEELSRPRRDAEKEPGAEGRQNEEELERQALKERARRREEQARRERLALEAPLPALLVGHRLSEEAAEEGRRHRAAEEVDAEANRMAWEHEAEWLRRTSAPPPWHRRVLDALFQGGPEPEAPPRRFLFACELGDPISCLHLGPGGGCMAGTMQGRVLLLPGPGDVSAAGCRWGRAPGSPKWPQRALALAGFSDEGVRGLYLDKEGAHAALSDGVRSWRRARPCAEAGDICFRSLDRKNMQSPKYALQRGSWICVLFPLSTSLVNVARREHHLRAFRLFDIGGSSGEVAPCDFDSERLILVDRTCPEGVPTYHLVHLESNEQIELEDLPEAATIVRLWGADCVACAVGRTLHLYDYRKRRLRHRLQGHGADIIAVDAHDSHTIATLSSDAVVKLWSGTTGRCTRTLRVLGANFFLGYPYCLCFQDQRILISCDEGAYLIELGAVSEEV